MNKEKLKIFMKEVDKTKKPKHWQKFIIENTISHNLILKFGNRAFCTHCQKYFDKKVNIYPYKKETCDWCKNDYYVRNCNLKNYTIVSDIAFYTKVNGKIVLRVFEIESKYDYETKTFKRNLQEYARFVPGIGIIINNAVYFYMWNQKIWHNLKYIKWHIYTGNKCLYKMPIYPYNKKSLYKGTSLEYAPIKEFKEKFPYYNEYQILHIGAFPSFEFLWKMGLYNLSKFPKDFNKKGNFQKRFGVPKNFLKFMVENNIDYYDFVLLKILQNPDKTLIEKYKKFDFDYLRFMKKEGYLYNLDILNKFEYNFLVLKDISKYVPLRKFLNYEKGLKNMYIYRDYLQMADKLNYSIKSKKRLFPKQLKARHDELQKKLKITKDMNTQFACYLRYLELSTYTYDNDKYLIFPAPSVSDLTDEGIQQGNCVAYRYLNEYVNKKTEIFFIRKLNDVTKSFITLEFKDGKIIQKELPHHSKEFTREQLDFIDAWCNFRKLIDKKEKYQSKCTEKTKKYDLKRIVA